MSSEKIYNSPEEKKSEVESEVKTEVKTESKCSMKGMGVIVGAACGALIVGSSVFGAAIMDKHEAKAEEGPSSIAISANSEVTTVPDVFGLTFSIETQNKDSAEAAKENSDKCSAMLNYLKDELKIPDKDIQTTDKRLNPEYKWDSVNNEQVMTGYNMTTSFKVTTEDSEVLGKLISGIPALGANRIGNISYEVSNYDELYNEALKLAVEKARARADAIMSATNQKVVGVINVSENGYNPVPIAYKNYEFAANVASDVGASDNISVGESSVTANVTVTFEIEDINK